LPWEITSSLSLSEQNKDGLAPFRFPTRENPKEIKLKDAAIQAEFETIMAVFATSKLQ
jgi:hypothetical protein